MPNIKDQSTVDKIAQAFCEHRCKSRALQAGGYSEHYSKRAGLKLFTNVHLQGAIKAIDEAGAAKAERTVQSLDLMYQQAYDLAQSERQPAAMNGSVTGIARLYGMDKDAGGGSADVPKELSKEQVEALRKLAREATDTELAWPRLAKETA